MAARVLAALMLVAGLLGHRGPSPAEATWDAETARFLTLINTYRQQNGNLAQLQGDATLQAASDWFSQDMLANCVPTNRCSHTDSLGRDPFTRMRAFGYPVGTTAGGAENILWGQGGTIDAQQAFDLWKNSPDHNRNMLDSTFRAIGIARSCGSVGCAWVTNFGTQVTQPFTPPGTNPTQPVFTFSGATFDPISSTFFLRSTPTTGPADIIVSFGPVGTGRAVPLLGDWDGNGTYTVGLYDPDLSRFYLRNSNTSGGADVIFDFGAAIPLGSTNVPIPVVGDWTGVGYSQVGLYDPFLSRFVLRVGPNANGAAAQSVIYVDFGTGTQVGAAYTLVSPIVGNWEGSTANTAKVGLYVPSQSRFLLKMNGPFNGSAGQADVVVTFGNPNGGYQPVVGDWNGNGKSSPGLYLTNGSIFFATNSVINGNVPQADLTFQLTGPANATTGVVRALAGRFAGFAAAPAAAADPLLAGDASDQ